MLSSGSVVRVIGQKEVEAKLLAAAPRILEQNRLMVTAMLAEVKPIVVADTPFGPGHFGYHARDRFEVRVRSKAFETIGELRGAIQAYWREYGTGSRFRGNKGRNALSGYLSKLGGAAAVHQAFGTGGEPAFMTAHKALSGIKKFINAYYGMAAWWRA